MRSLFLLSRTPIRYSICTTCGQLFVGEDLKRRCHCIQRQPRWIQISREQWEAAGRLWPHERLQWFFKGGRYAIVKEKRERVIRPLV